MKEFAGLSFGAALFIILLSVGVFVLIVFGFQVTKGARRMPWGKGPKKDAVSGETQRGAAIRL